MRQCHISCDISSQYLSHNTFGFKGEQNSKRFCSLFVFWSIHVTCMFVFHSTSPYSNPNALQATWNVECFVSSIVRICSKEVTPNITISRRWRKKHSPIAGRTKYIHPTTFYPCCRAKQIFFQIFQTWSTWKSTYTTFHPFAFWVLYAK
jgi:hypothetical protein